MAHTRLAVFAVIGLLATLAVAVLSGMPRDHARFLIACYLTTFAVLTAAYVYGPAVVSWLASGSAGP